MPSIYHAKNVDPATVTLADLAEIYDEFDLSTVEPGPADFFQPNTTYARSAPGGTDTFHATAVAWQWDGTPIAIGYAPINLAGERTWEFAFQGARDWARGWTADPTLAPTPTTGARA